LAPVYLRVQILRAFASRRNYEAEDAPRYEQRLVAIAASGSVAGNNKTTTTVITWLQNKRNTQERQELVSLTFVVTKICCIQWTNFLSCS
jgi:hypothetical protein